MSRLNEEFRRLYLPADGSAADGATGNTARALVLEVARPASWRALGAVWQGVQADFGWPAPAIAVNGVDGLQLWFSVAEPVPLAEAQAVLRGLTQRYLAELASHRVAAWPAAAPLAALAWPAVPALQAAPVTQGAEAVWSAFVAPDLAAIFEDTPWLDLPPGGEGQAALLARCRSVPPGPWQAACVALAVRGPVVAPAPAVALAPASLPALTSDGGHDAPRQGAAQAREFLLRVLQDEGAPLALRVEAAKALMLPG